MEQFKLRVTINEDSTRSSMRLYEKKYFSSFLRVEEVGKDTGKHHYHYYFTSVTKTDTLRQSLSRNVGKGNGVYSLTRFREILPELPWDYLSYMLKECNLPEWQNIEEDIRKQIEAYAAEVKKQVQKGKRGGKVDILRKKIIEMNPNVNDPIPASASQLSYAIVKIYLEEGWSLNRHRIAEYVQTILAQESTKFRQDFEKSIVDLVMRN